MQLENRVVLVTGGDRGIGQGIALALAEAGADEVAAAERGTDAGGDKGQLVVYLAGAAHVTGQAIAVDGGFSL